MLSLNLSSFCHISLSYIMSFDIKEVIIYFETTQHATTMQGRSMQCQPPLIFVIQQFDDKTLSRKRVRY